MDASQCELLVHITAGSTAHDDKRYTSIAQSILDFRPATVIKVAGPQGMSAEGSSTAEKDISGMDDTNVPSTSRYRRDRDSQASSQSDSLTTCSASRPQRRCYGPAGQCTRRNTSLSDACPAELDRSSRRKRQRLEGEKTNDNNEPSHKQHQISLSTPQSRNLRSKSVPLGTPARQSSPSPSSTVSPSQPWEVYNWAPRTRLLASSSPPGSAVIDLTTPKHPSRGSEEPRLHRPRRSQSQRPPSLSDSDGGRSKSSHQSGAFVQKLPDSVRGPDPKGGRPRFTTHLTKTLESVSTRAPPSKYFRPAYVARDVGVLERGYWQFSVKIGDSTVEKSGGSSGGKMNDRHWTEKEFGQFWLSISQFIQQGKAGWGTRLVKEGRDNNEWRIRLFTWAELLGHVWVILWILSDKLIRGVPMQWFAGDGSVIVQMSGGKSGPRRSSVWMRKGPEGEGGAWGLGRPDTEDLGIKHS